MKTHDVSDMDYVISVTMPLEKGKALLKTAFLDDRDNIISGVYYVDISYLDTLSSHR